MRKSIRKSFTGKLLAAVMMLTLLFAAIPTASAATALKTDQKVNISVKCTKPGYTFELFRVADLKSTTATPFKTEYTSLINSISAEILAGDSKAALDALDMNKRRKEKVIEKPYKKKLIKRRKPNRSIVGDFFIYLALALIAAAMAFPLVFAISSWHTDTE